MFPSVVDFKVCFESLPICTNHSIFMISVTVSLHFVGNCLNLFFPVPESWRVQVLLKSVQQTSGYLEDLQSNRDSEMLLLEAYEDSVMFSDLVLSFLRPYIDPTVSGTCHFLITFQTEEMAA